MQTFESGGALWMRPHARLRAALIATVAGALALSPVLGLYLLIVA